MLCSESIVLDCGVLGEGQGGAGKHTVKTVFGCKVTCNTDLQTIMLQ